MNEQNNPILEVKNLRVSYHTYAGEVKAVRGVQFSLEKGQALAIVGESGCGKSVTAKSIMGLIKAPQGEIKENSEILYNGENILKYNKKQWQHYKGGECAIIFQDALASLNPTMRVGKQIMENLMGHKNMTKQEAAKEAMANIGGGLGTSISFARSAGQQVAMDITRGLMQGGSQYLAKKFRTVKVHLKAGDPLMLYAKQQ